MPVCKCGHKCPKDYIYPDPDDGDICANCANLKLSKTNKSAIELTKQLEERIELQEGLLNKYRYNLTNLINIISPTALSETKN